LRISWVSNAEQANAEMAISAGTCRDVLTMGVPETDTN
jgi:hypothetical protein